MMKTCPQCGATNRLEACFCRQCRSPLPAIATRTCPCCGASLRPDARFCRECGRPIPAAPSAASPALCPQCSQPIRPQARFCPYCGARIGTPASAPSPPPVSGGPGRVCPYCGAPVRPSARFCPQCRAPLVAPSPPIPSPPLPPAKQPGRFGTGELLPLSVLADRYVILEKIAQGGMGAVYKAQDKRLQDRIVAVKEMAESAIPPEERPRVLEGFQREAQLLAKLEHPNLVRVTDLFVDQGRHYLVMEFVAGQTLRNMLEERTEPFPEDLVLIWADQLCDVLAYLHSQEPKIIYRDMKPDNVMVVRDSDTVKLIDFGIARFYKPGKRRDTVEFGTKGYAPPEQYGKAQTDERSDVYALGAMLHQLLTLRDPASKPFDFPPIRTLNPKVSQRVADAIAKAVEPNPAKRHQSAEEMRSALVGGKAPRQRPSEAAKQPTTPSKSPGLPLPASHKITVVPPSVDFGTVTIGSPAPIFSLVVTLPAGDTATVHTGAPWLRAHPQTLKGSEQITLTPDMDILRPMPEGQQVQTYVEIQVKGGKEHRVPVTLTVARQPQRVNVGQIILLLFLLGMAVLCYLLSTPR